jgi:hypothetical protein
MKPHRLVVVAVSALLAQACGEVTKPPMPTRMSQARVAAASEGRNPHFARSTVSEHFKRLSTEAPGFTGLFYDEDQVLVVTVARDDFSNESRDAVVAWARTYAGVARDAMVKVKRVKYDYASLDVFRETVQRLVRIDDATRRFDIDERRGLVVVGLEDLGRVNDLRSRFRQAGIPNDAVAFELAYRGTVDVGFLEQQVRPTMGGYKITEHDGGACTLGINVMKYETGTDSTSPKYLMTAGHCAPDNYWGILMTDWPFYQGGGLVGIMHATAPFRTNDPSCPDYEVFQCTDADVLIVAYDDTVAASYLKVVKIAWFFNQWNYLGFRGITEPAIALEGATVFMLGHVSGDMEGVVTAVDVNDLVTKPGGGQVWVLGNVLANYSSVGGDSGGPVYLKTGTQTGKIVDIHSGVVTGTSTRRFSPMSQIDKALDYAFFFNQP